MRYRYICEDCDAVMRSERDLDVKPNGTPCCPQCGSTDIEVCGVLYEMQELNVKVEKVNTSDVIRNFKNMTEGRK